MSEHAFLPPSSSERWLECTPSATLEALEPIGQPSIYAAEGTEAHELSYLKLSFMLGKISVEEYDTRFESFMINSRFYNAEFNEFVNDYCAEIMAIVKEDYQNENVEVFLEERVDYSHIVPKGSGTADVAIVGRNFIHIVDLKFGRGIAKNAVANPQLRLYALGGLRKYQLLGVFTEVRMTIIQPRLYDMSTDIMSVIELNDWAMNYVKPRAELAIAGKGELVPGEHCQFCKRKGKCEALGNKQLTVAQQEFEEVIVKDSILEPHNMTPEMFSRILTIAPKFIDWFKDVTKYAVNAMINEGLKVPGYKVVEGKSNRIVLNPDIVVNKLKTAGFTEKDYLKPIELLGITKLEQNVGKKLFNELCGEYVIKPIGKPTIAIESDRRMALEVGQYKLIGQEFENEEGDYQE